jgi:hypothetical protein
MIRRCWLYPTIALVVAAVPATALATRLGVARLVNVVAVDGGCLSGPTGPAVQSWDVEAGKTYTVTIGDATECANGGTDPTLGVRINNSLSGNTDIVATRVAPARTSSNIPCRRIARCTMPVFHCTSAGAAKQRLLHPPQRWRFLPSSPSGSELRAGLHESPGRVPADAGTPALVGAAQDDLPVTESGSWHFRPRGEGPTAPSLLP